jgi:hypothetical protein
MQLKLPENTSEQARRRGDLMEIPETRSGSSLVFSQPNTDESRS